MKVVTRLLKNSRTTTIIILNNDNVVRLKIRIYCVGRGTIKMKVNVMTKKLMSVIFEICDTIDETLSSSDNYTYDPGDEMFTKDILRTNWGQLLMYLVGSKRIISDEEAEYISDTCECEENLPVEFIREKINEYNIYSEEFENTIPVSLLTIINADNLLYSQNESQDTYMCELVYTVYNDLAREFLTIEGYPTDQQLQDYMIYMTMLKSTIENNLNPNVSLPSPENIIVGNNDTTNLETSESPTEMETVVNDNNEQSLEELLEELNGLVGLESVKNDVNSLINLLQIRKMREDRGMKQSPMSLHLVFSGNPGTGKTTVARLLAKIYHSLGILSKGHLVEVDRSGLVGGYVGQTAIKVQEVIQKSLGGVLFIDEAYSLTANKSENDYGYEAVDTLLKGMEDHRDDLIVIVAGYPELMEEFLNSNPGLRSRFNKFINFIDYSPEELSLIFSNMCVDSGYIADEDCMNFVRDYFTKECASKTGDFANGREVRNFFEQAMTNQANRLAMESELTDEKLMSFELTDLEMISM